MPSGSRLEDYIKKAYEIIGSLTPIKADCGALCGAACCKDYPSATSDSATPDPVGRGIPDAPPTDPDRTVSPAHPDSLGMLLFPGEIKLLSQEPGYRFFRIPYMGESAWFMVCEGVCDRRKRPLACRIFPLAPQIGDSGEIRALPDPRAGRMCPLAGGEFLNPAFRRAVEKALRHISQAPEIYDFMRLLSADLDEMRKFMRYIGIFRNNLTDKKN